MQNLREYRAKSKGDDGYIFIFYQDAYAIYEPREVFEMMGMSFG